jgi:hypothetical protein
MDGFITAIVVTPLAASVLGTPVGDGDVFCLGDEVVDKDSDRNK